MFITVIYRGGKVGMVRSDALDGLINSNKIEKFMRSEGWVDISIDPIRKRNQGDRRPERRHNLVRT